MKLSLTSIFIIISVFALGQPKKAELFNLVKKLTPDSIDGIGDWAVGKPALFPIQWKANRVEMSDDMKINFFRNGSANITVKGVLYKNIQQQPVKWNIMLRGPRAGYTNYNISSENSPAIQPKLTLDSLFGNSLYAFKLIKSCNASATAGFYYYQCKIPKKEAMWIKAAWACNNGGCSIILDCYDDFSKAYADINCAK